MSGSMIAIIALAIFAFFLAILGICMMVYNSRSPEEREQDYRKEAEWAENYGKNKYWDDTFK